MVDKNLKEKSKGGWKMKRQGKKKILKLGGEVVNTDEAVYKWLDEFRTTEKGKVSFNEILHYLIDEYEKLKKLQLEGKE